MTQEGVNSDSFKCVKQKVSDCSPVSSLSFSINQSPRIIKHSRCQPQGTHLQMLAEGNLSIYTYFPSQPLWALSEDSRDTSHNFPLLLVYFYPSCMNQSVTYCPTVQSLTLVKLLIPFDIFKKKNI